MTSAAIHLCDGDPLDLGRLVYLPALDPDATSIPGGARVLAPLPIASIPAFDYDAHRDGPCWICAYGEALRTRRLEPPSLGADGLTDDVVVDEATMRLRASARLRGLAGVAKRALARVDVERRVAEDAVPRDRWIEVAVTPATRLVHTARIDSIDPHRLDVTRKSAGPDGIAFAPSWPLLRRTLLKFAGGTAMPWEQYAAAYVAEMEVSRRENPEAWAALLRRPRVVLVCYCVDPSHCHRTLLAREILPKLDPHVVYAGEVGEEEERERAVVQTSREKQVTQVSKHVGKQKKPKKQRPGDGSGGQRGLF